MWCLLLAGQGLLTRCVADPSPRMKHLLLPTLIST